MLHRNTGKGNIGTAESHIFSPHADAKIRTVCSVVQQNIIQMECVGLPFVGILQLNGRSYKRIGMLILYNKTAFPLIKIFDRYIVIDRLLRCETITNITHYIQPAMILHFADPAGSPFQSGSTEMIPDDISHAPGIHSVSGSILAIKLKAYRRQVILEGLNEVSLIILYSIGLNGCGPAENNRRIIAIFCPGVRSGRIRTVRCIVNGSSILITFQFHFCAGLHNPFRYISRYILQ